MHLILKRELKTLVNGILTPISSADAFLRFQILRQSNRRRIVRETHRSTGRRSLSPRLRHRTSSASSTDLSHFVCPAFLLVSCFMIFLFQPPPFFLTLSLCNAALDNEDVRFDGDDFCVLVCSRCHSCSSFSHDRLPAVLCTPLDSANGICSW